MVTTLKGRSQKEHGSVMTFRMCERGGDKMSRRTRTRTRTRTMYFRRKKERKRKYGVGAKSRQLNEGEIIINLKRKSGENLRKLEKSSTSITFPIKCSGERSRTECTVLKRTDQASLWKQMMTSVTGRLVRKRPGSLHLNRRKNIKKQKKDNHYQSVS